MLSAIGTGLGSVFSTILNYTESRKQKDFNNNLATEQFNYQKELNNQIMEREDNAIQRRSKDLLEAGLNPLLAGQGDGAGAGAVAGSSVRGNEEASQIADLGNISTAMLSNLAETQNINKSKAEQDLLTAKYLTEIENKLNVKEDTLLKQIQGKKGEQDIEKTKKEIDNLKKINEQISHDLNLSKKYSVRMNDLFNTQYNTTKAVLGDLKDKLDYNLEEMKKDRVEGKATSFDIDDETYGEWEYIGKNEGGGKMYRNRVNGRIKYE